MSAAALIAIFLGIFLSGYLAGRDGRRAKPRQFYVSERLAIDLGEVVFVSPATVELRNGESKFLKPGEGEAICEALTGRYGAIFPAPAETTAAHSA